LCEPEKIAKQKDQTIVVEQLGDSLPATKSMISKKIRLDEYVDEKLMAQQRQLLRDFANQLIVCRC
jgi:hypothetical protein